MPSAQPTEGHSERNQLQGASHLCYSSITLKGDDKQIQRSQEPCFFHILKIWGEKTHKNILFSTNTLGQIPQNKPQRHSLIILKSEGFCRRSRNLRNYLREEGKKMRIRQIKSLSVNFYSSKVKQTTSKQIDEILSNRYKRHK